MVYEIVLKAHLTVTTKDYFDPISTKILETGQTKLVVNIEDQAALHGVIGKIRNLNIDLIELKQVKE